MNGPLYRLLLLLLFPWLVFDAWRRWRQAPAQRRRLFAQFGRLPDHLPGRCIWLHAVSLGEIRAAAVLIEALKQRWPDVPLVVSTTTETGARAARDLGVPHFYAPYDYAWVVRRVLGRLRPRMLVIMETELWPNWVAEASRRSVPVAIVNARLSDRSYRSYRRLGGPLLRQTLSRLDMICAQSAEDRERFLRLGGDQAPSVIDCGNLKFDVPRPTCGPASIPLDRPVWLAASTHPGEEALILDVHARLRQRYPSALLILVPRHPERADEVEALVQRTGFEMVRHGAELSPASSVLLVDRTGVLMPYFAAVPVVFMGGSLVPLGGHNPIEPAIFGRAVITGPEVRNFRAIYTDLRKANAVAFVEDVDGLERAVEQAWLKPDDWRTVGANAEAVVVRNRGATACVIEELAELLD